MEKQLSAEEYELSKKQISLKLYRQASSNKPQQQKIANVIPITPQPKDYATLILPNGKETKLPILEPSEGSPMIDIQRLYAETGLFTYDPGK